MLNERNGELVTRPWQPGELPYYRDLLRSARNAALEDAEGFEQICFALEELGQRLLGKNEDLHGYKVHLKALGQRSYLFDDTVTGDGRRTFASFDALFDTVRVARNDAMHTGARARRATDASVELCLGLEDALMTNAPLRRVGDFMVKSPTIVEEWNLIARARQLMLMHSFSFLPVKIGKEWKMVSELSLAKYLNVVSATRKARLAQTITEAVNEPHDPLVLAEVHTRDLLAPEQETGPLLARSNVGGSPMLWLVLDKEHLVGVLSPFDLI